MSYLSDEYKALQDKIDKIGAFRFTIKGWSVTVVVAGLIAGAASKDGSPVLIATVLDACLIFFFLFEREQVRISWKFGERVREIEREVDRMRRANRWTSRFSSPRIARLFFDQNQRSPFKILLKKLRLEWLWKRLIDTTWKPLNKWLEKLGFQSLDSQLKLLKKSDGLFYLFLICLSWSPLLIHPLRDNQGGNVSNRSPNMKIEVRPPDLKPEVSKPSPAVVQHPGTAVPNENNSNGKEPQKAKTAN